MPTPTPAPIDSTGPGGDGSAGLDLPRGAVTVAARALEVLDVALGPDRAGPDTERASEAMSEGLEVRARALLALRARLLGLRPHGRTSAGGSCRLLAARDGWLAVNLPRPGDLDLLPAWLGVAPEASGGTDPWVELARILADRPVAELTGDGQTLGLAVAGVAAPADLARGDEQLRARGATDPREPWIVEALGRTADGGRGGASAGPTVVDLSSLWAGPSCTQLLRRRGSHVRKIESTERPDGARRGPAAFFAAVNAGKAEVALPLHRPEGRQALREQLDEADVIVEGSRPRALEQMGIEPAEVLGRRPGKVWVSVTGYGRRGPWANRVAFGDDAAAAGGLLRWEPDATPAFVGDALADPLAGVVAAALAAAVWRRGGGALVDVSLREVARAAALGAPLSFDAVPHP